MNNRNSIATPPKGGRRQSLSANASSAASRWGTAISGARRMSERRQSNFRNALVEIDPFLERFTLVGRADDSEEEGIPWTVYFTSAFWKELVIDPEMNFYYYWSMLVTLAIYYNMIVILMRAVFMELRAPEYMPVWYTFDYLCDVMYIIDSFVKSRLGFLEQGILVTDVKRLTMVYIKSWRAVMDLLAIIPLDLFYFLVGTNPLLRLNRILKIWRLNEFHSDSETRTSAPILFRLSFLIVNICVFIHLNACVYFAMSKALGLASDEWVYDDTKEGRDTFTMKYLHSFYWSMLTLTAIGDTPPPERAESVMYCITCMLIGVLIFATIFGNIGSMINQMNASRSEFQHNVDAVKRYMEIRKVGSDLQARVIQWFAYTWNNKQSIDDRQALSILPEKLRAEIAIHVHLDTLKRVAIFQDCEPGLLVELVLKLRLQVFSPGDYICRKGDIGKEMYIIKRGKLEVVSEDGKKVFATLSDGAVFGEVSILNIAGNKTGNRRTASVRSVGYSDLFCLSKDDLWDALKEYPEAKKILSEKGKQILRKDDLLDEEAARREELRSMSMDNRISLITMEIEKISLELAGLGGRLTDIHKHIGAKSSTSNQDSDYTLIPAVTVHTRDPQEPEAVKEDVKEAEVKEEVKEDVTVSSVVSDSVQEEVLAPPQTNSRRASHPVSERGSQATIHEEEETINIPGTPDNLQEDK